MAKIHVVIAAFFLPAALIFNLTGGLKFLQYKADKDETIRFQVELDKANPLGVRDMWDFANEHLGERGIEPVDAHALKGRKGSYVWPFISTHFIRFTPNYETGVGEFAITYHGTFNRFMKAHKGQGTPWFKYISIGWAFGLLILVISGVLMSLAIPSMKKWVVVSTLLGAATTYLALQ